MAIGPLGNVASPKLQFFLPGTNTPLAGGKLFTYAGGTTTKQATYASDAQTPNTNPIILDANGQCVCFVDTTMKYDFTLSPSTDTDPPTNSYWTVQNMGYQEMIASFAPINSPTFTGVPKGPTASLGDSSTALATTQFVQNTIAGGLANTALTGTPTAPTAAPGTSTTQIATTAFVGQEITRASMQQIFTASGTFTVPTGVTKLKVRVWGGGGGGGGSTGTGSAASGGGGGGYCEGVATVTPGASIPIVIGTGGSAGSGSSAGGAATATTVAALSVTANGGGGGPGSSSGGTSVGGTGGTASGLSFAVTGTVGSFGNNLGGTGLGGTGGGTFCSASSTAVGSFPGGGGGGGGAGLPGNVGGAGMVILEWLQP